MRIVVLTLDYPPHRIIGAELAIHRLVKRLMRAGHTVEVRILADTAAHFDGVRAAPHGKAPLWNPDVVITNAGLATRVRRVWPDVPRVVWAHNNQIGALLDVKEADPQIVISNTRHMRDVFMSVNAQDSMVLYPIPDPTITRLEERGTHATLINGSREKGGQVVTEAAALIPSVEFLVVRGGHGPQVPQTSPNVETIDPQPDLSDVWARTGVLLVPSHLESYSMVGFEALQRGIPVIARALPGVIEALSYRLDLADRYTDTTFIMDRDPVTWAREIKSVPEPGSMRDLRFQETAKTTVHVRMAIVDAQVAELLERLEEL